MAYFINSLVKPKQSGYFVNALSKGSESNFFVNDLINTNTTPKKYI